MAGRPGRSKRKRLEVEEPLGTGSSGIGSGSSTSSSSSFHMAQQASASGSISIEEIDLEGKFVQLKNSSDKVRPLTPTRWEALGSSPNCVPLSIFPARISLWATGGSRGRS